MKGISSKAKVSKKLTKKATAHLDIDNKTANHGTMKRIISATYQELEVFDSIADEFSDSERAYFDNELSEVIYLNDDYESVDDLTFEELTGLMS